jgi:pyruvate,water dikinase
MSATPLATALVVPFEQLRMTDVETVGGKNASLGEMISQLAASGVRVPGGFATTAHAFRQFLRTAGWTERIAPALATLNTDDVRALAEAGAQIRGWVVDTPFPADLEAAIRAEFARLAATTRAPASPCAPRPPPRTCPTPRSPASRRPSSTSVASTTCCTAIKEVFASLYNDRAISYRVHKGFAHADVALSAGVQRMVRSDLARPA